MKDPKPRHGHPQTMPMKDVAEIKNTFGRNRSEASVDYCARCGHRLVDEPSKAQGNPHASPTVDPLCARIRDLERTLNAVEGVLRRYKETLEGWGDSTARVDKALNEIAATTVK